MNIASDLREQLLRILDAVAIHSASSFTFAGYTSTGLAPPMMGLQLEATAPPLMNELVSMLYQHSYSTPFNGKFETANHIPIAPDPTLVDALTRANQSRERWEDGWTALQSMPTGQIVARKGTSIRMFTPGEFINLSGSGMALAPGTILRIYAPRESRTVQPGYYFAFGETIADSSDEYSMARFYWNIATDGATRLLGAVSGTLNRWQIPFRFKTGTHPSMHMRSDGAVLYVPRRTAGLTYELLLDVRTSVQTWLREDVPLFTLRLADGFAFADDPGTHESFGMSRCRMLAQAMWMAHRDGARASEDRLSFVEREFQAEGVSLERPWLNPGYSDGGLFAVLEGAAA